MEYIVQGIVAVAWLAIVAILLWILMEGMGKFLKDDGPLPFFKRLEREGLTRRRIEDAVGMDEFVRAVRRCTFCAARSKCGRYPVDCPNEPLLRRVRVEAGAA